MTDDLSSPHRPVRLLARSQSSTCQISLTCIFPSGFRSSCYTKGHGGETSKDRRSTRPENVEVENSIRRPQIGKRLKKKKIPVLTILQFSLFLEHLVSLDTASR